MLLPTERKPGEQTSEGPRGTLHEGARGWEIRIVACLLVVAPFLLTPWVHGDGIMSVAFLRSVVVDGDLDLADEFSYLSTHIAADAGGLPGALLERSAHAPGLDRMFHTGARDPATGRVSFIAAVGPPIVWSPAYAAAYATSRLADAVGLHLRTDGYGGLYYLAIALTSLGCGIAGLLLMFRLTRSIVGARTAFWAVLGFAGASPLLYYLYMAPSYPHSITMLSTGAFTLYWWKTRGSVAPAVWFRWGLLAGFLFVVRWNDAVIAAPVFALEIVRYVRRGTFGPRGASAGGLPARLGAALAGALIVASVQLVVWQYFHGRPWVRYPAGELGFWYEGLWGAFVSSRHGLFIWHPITIAAVIGLLLLFRRDKELAGVSVATLALLVASNSTIDDWWCGASFGIRRLLSAAPVFVLGLGAFFAAIGEWLARHHMRARLAAPIMVLAFSGWNALLLLQYSLGMISHTGPVGFAAIAANQPKALVRAIRLIGELIR
jgi:hypothetical protein